MILAGSTKVVRPGEALQTSLDWAARMASHPPNALAEMKRMLAESEEYMLDDAVINDQRVFQSFSGGLSAIDNMEKLQTKFGEGVELRESYWLD